MKFVITKERYKTPQNSFTLDTFGGANSCTIANNGYTTDDTVTGCDLFTYPYPWDRTEPWKEVYKPITHVVSSFIMEEPKKEEGKYKMETLFHVIVTNLDREIVLDTKIVAEDVDDAKFSAGVFEKLKEKNLKPKEVTIVVNEIANVKVRKEEDEKKK
jgi:hypothetical protein